MALLVGSPPFFVQFGLFNAISLTRCAIRCCRMIYLLRKHDIRTRPADEIKDFERVPRNLVIRCAHNNLRSFICRRHISSHDSAISYRRYITRSARNGYHCKKPLLSGRQKRFFTCLRVTKRSGIGVKVSKSSVMIIAD